MLTLEHLKTFARSLRRLSVSVLFIGTLLQSKSVTAQTGWTTSGGSAVAGAAGTFDSIRNLPLVGSVSASGSNQNGSGAAIGNWGVTTGGAFYTVAASGIGGVQINFAANGPVISNVVRAPGTPSPAGGLQIGGATSISIGAKANSIDGLRYSEFVTWDEPTNGSKRGKRDNVAGPSPPGFDPGRNDSDDESEDEQDSRAVDAQPVTGSYLTPLPVADEHGVSEPVYYGATAVGAPNAESPTEYYFGSLTNLKFTSFVLPDSIAGNTSRLIIDDGRSYTFYTPGTTHVFTSPVDDFALRNLDPTTLPPRDQPFPFVWGATYDQAGAAFVHQAAYLPTYPGDFNADGTVDAGDYTIWRDGLGTRFVTEDYDLWREHFGESATGSGAGDGNVARAAAPEPTTATLLFVATIQFLVANARRPKLR